MARLSPDDWRELKRTYGVAFSKMPDELFERLLKSIYSTEKSNPGELETDAIMIYLSHSEPPIPPVK